MIEVRYHFPDKIAAFTIDAEAAGARLRFSTARLAMEHIEYGARPKEEGHEPTIVELVPVTHWIEPGTVEHRPQERIL